MKLGLSRRGKILTNKLDQAYIAAIQTLVGYSINDSVVVFDRIREFMGNYKTETNMAKLINDAINQTFIHPDTTYIF